MMIWPSVAPLPSLFICVTTLKVTFSRPYLEIMRSLCLSYMLMGGSSSLYKICLKSPGTDVGAAGFERCPRTFETDFINLGHLQL